MALFVIALGTPILAVVPILPALPALLVVLPMVALSLVVGAAALLRPAVIRRAAGLMWRQRWALLIVLGAATGGTWVLARATAPGQRPPDLISATGPDWPMERGGIQRLGAISGAPVPATPASVWTYRRGDEAFYSSPTIVGDRLYVVGSRGDRGRIYCLNAHTGDVLWSVSPSGYRATFSSPVVAGNYLVCGEGLHHARQARVVCIDLRDEYQGQVIWQFTTQGHVECTPVISNGRVYFGAGDDGVYCLDLTKATAGKPLVHWHAPGPQYPDAETSIAVYGDRVFVGLGVGGNALCVLDRDTGRELKRIALPYPVFSPPAIHGQKLYVGMGVGDYVTPNEQPAGQVVCIDLEKLEMEWSFNTQATVLGAVIHDGHGIVFGCANGDVVRLNELGNEVARYRTHTAIVNSPAVTPQAVFVVNSGGMLYALASGSLDRMWEQRLGHWGRFLSSPVVAHGHLYVGTEADGLMCVGQPSTAESWGEWPGDQGGAGYAGCRDSSEIPNAAQLLWQFPPGDGGRAIITAPVAPAGAGILVPVAAGDLAGLVYLDTSNAQSPRVQWQIALADGVWSSPTVANGKAFIVSGQRGDAGRMLRVYSVGDASAQWSHPIGGEAAGLLLADEHSIIVQPERNAMSALDHRGDVIWRQSIGRIEQLVSGNAAVLAVAITEPPALVLLDRPTGKELWREPLVGQPTSAPVIRGQTILIGTTAAVELRRIEDGRVMARSAHAFAGVRGPMLVDKTNCVFITSDNKIVAARIRDLETVAIMNLEANMPQNFLLTSRGGLIEYGGQLRRLHHAADKIVPTRWLDTSSLGRITSPLVMHDSRLYMGVDNRGLVCIAEGPRE